ncbi:MAG: TIGR00268 family protein, partial [Bacteroidota bacterium]
ETLLRDNGFKYFRVRHHDENTVRIEVGKNEVARFFDDGLRETIVSEIKKLGFKYVTLDLEGYRTGSMNEVLSEEEKQAFDLG